MLDYMEPDISEQHKIAGRAQEMIEAAWAEHGFRGDPPQISSGLVGMVFSATRDLHREGEIEYTEADDGS